MGELLGLYVLVQGVIEFLTVYVFDMLFDDLADEFCEDLILGALLDQIGV